MNHWSNKRVGLNDSWGVGADHTLKTPIGEQAEFYLRPRYLRDARGKSQLAQFSIDFSSGFLADGWQGVNFIPMGNTPVSGMTGLPPWDPSQRDVYRKAIDAATVTLGDSRTSRLEAVVPYIDSGTSEVGYNKVRLFYVANAVTGKVKDLVIVKIATHASAPGTVQGRQDGTAHGPPD